MVRVGPCHHPSNCQGSPASPGSSCVSSWKADQVLPQKGSCCGLVGTGVLISSVPLRVQWCQPALCSSGFCIQSQFRMLDTHDLPTKKNIFFPSLQISSPLSRDVVCVLLCFQFLMLPSILSWVKALRY